MWTLFCYSGIEAKMSSPHIHPCNMGTFFAMGLRQKGESAARTSIDCGEIERKKGARETDSF